MLVAVLVLLNAVVPFSVDMYLAAFPQIAREFDASSSTVQMTLTAFLVGMACGQLVIGNLSDGYGRKRPLVIGTALSLGASVLCISTTSVGVLTGLRFAQGFGGAAGIVIARAIITDRTSGSASARLLATMIGIGVLVPIAAPVLGGLIITASGWRAVFAVLAAMNAVALLGVLLVIDESLPSSLRRGGGAKSLGVGFREVLRNRSYVGYAAAIALTTGAMFAFIAASPFVLQNMLGMQVASYTATMGGCSLAVALGTVIAGRAVGNSSPHTLVVAGGIMTVVASGLLLFTVTAGHALKWATITLMVCFMASVGFSYANTTALAMAQVRHAAGTGSALIGFMQYGAGAMTSPLVGMAGRGSAVPMGLVMSGTAVAALAAVVLLPPTRAFGRASQESRCRCGIGRRSLDEGQQ